MKKDLIFAPALIVIAALLFVLKLTGMTAHIAISVVGVVLLVAYAVVTKKEWKIPALEIAMRALYAVALITGIVIMNVAGLGALAIVHKVAAALFAVALVIIFVHKIITAKKA